MKETTEKEREPVNRAGLKAPRAGAIPDIVFSIPLIDTAVRRDRLWFGPGLS